MASKRRKFSVEHFRSFSDPIDSMSADGDDLPGRKFSCGATECPAEVEVTAQMAAQFEKNSQLPVQLKYSVHLINCQRR